VFVVVRVIRVRSGGKRHNVELVFKDGGGAIMSTFSMVLVLSIVSTNIANNADAIYILLLNETDAVVRSNIAQFAGRAKRSLTINQSTLKLAWAIMLWIHTVCSCEELHLDCVARRFLNWFTYINVKKLQFIHTINGDGSKTAKLIKRQC